MKNTRTYDPLDPIECLELHLKKVAVDDYGGMGPDVDFIKFFVLNAKVLKEMYLDVVPSCNDKWMANQRRRLQLDNKASPDARFAFDNRAAGRVFNSGMKKKSAITDKVEISGISGFFIFIFTFLFFMFTF